MKFEGSNILGKSVLSRLFSYNFPLYESSNQPQKSQGVHFVPPLQTESGRNSRLDSVFFPGEAFASQAASKPFAPSIPAVGNSRSADFSFYGNASVVVSQTKNRFDR